MHWLQTCISKIHHHNYHHHDHHNYFAWQVGWDHCHCILRFLSSHFDISWSSELKVSSLWEWWSLIVLKLSLTSKERAHKYLLLGWLSHIHWSIEWESPSSTCLFQCWPYLARLLSTGFWCQIFSSAQLHLSTVRAISYYLPVVTKSCSQTA